MPDDLVPETGWRKFSSKIADAAKSLETTPTKRATPRSPQPAPPLTLRRYKSDEIHGYTFTDTNGRLVRNADCGYDQWKSLKVLTIWVQGVHYNVDHASHVSFDPGWPLRLVAEPDNPYDRAAISVRNWAGDRKAGYVLAEDTERMRGVLKRARRWGVMSLTTRTMGPGRDDLMVVVFGAGQLRGVEHLPVVGKLDEGEYRD